MKRWILYVLMVLVLVASVGYGQTGDPASAVKWRQDLKYLVSELPRLHKNAFFVVPRSTFDKAVAALDSRLDTLSDAEVVVEMSKIVALVGDAETALSLAQPELKFHCFPISFTWLKDGYYATGTTAEYQTLLGSKLLKINGTDAETVIREISQVIPHENEYRVRETSPYYMVGAEILRALHIIRDTNATVFEFLAPDGVRLNQSIKAVALTDTLDWRTAPDYSRFPQPLYLENPGRFYWYEYLADTQDIYFQYNSCREIPQQSFARFSKELLNAIDKRPINRLIIDLRFNSGGNAMMLEPFVNELKKRPNINQRGRLFVIIGRKTFSAAVLNALKLKYETNAILVGEPTGGKPNHFGEAKSFVLPNSGLIVTYSTKYFNSVPEDAPTLTPNIMAETGAGDYFAGVDPALQSIMSFANP